MSQATLLYQGDPKVFHFEHSMDHRPWIGVLPPNLRFYYTNVPYMFGVMGVSEDPMGDPDWLLNHQQVHWDCLNPGPLAAEPIPPPGLPYPPEGVFSPLGPFGPPVTQVLWMGATKDQKWWTFANHQEHYLAARNIVQYQLPLYVPYW